MTVAHNALLHYDGNRRHHAEVMVTLLSHDFFMLLGARFQLLNAFALELILGNVVGIVWVAGSVEQTDRLITRFRNIFEQQDCRTPCREIALVVNVFIRDQNDRLLENIVESPDRFASSFNGGFLRRVRCCLGLALLCSVAGRKPGRRHHQCRKTKGDGEEFLHLDLQT